jgi:cytochrome c peroxidase
MEMIGAALAAYEQTLVSAGSPFDRYYYAKDTSALNAAAVRGFELFRGRANCSSCHPIGERWSLFTDQTFHVATRGLPAAVSGDLPSLAQRVVTARNAASTQALELLLATDAQVAALGRFVVTLEPADIGKFKTPSLRNVALTAPYMHDGGVAALAEAVELELYQRGTVTHPIILTRDEKADVLEFLKALSGIHVTR